MAPLRRAARTSSCPIGLPHVKRRFCQDVANPASQDPFTPGLCICQEPRLPKTLDPKPYKPYDFWHSRVSEWPGGFIGLQAGTAGFCGFRLLARWLWVFRRYVHGEPHTKEIGRTAMIKTLISFVIYVQLKIETWVLGDIYIYIFFFKG